MTYLDLKNNSMLVFIVRDGGRYCGGQFSGGGVSLGGGWEINYCIVLCPILKLTPKFKYKTLLRYQVRKILSINRPTI